MLSDSTYQAVEETCDVDECAPWRVMEEKCQLWGAVGKIHTPATVIIPVHFRLLPPFLLPLFPPDSGLLLH